MPAYWLTFKPREESPQGWPIENLKALVTNFQASPSNTTEWWRIAAGLQAKVGDRVFVFKQGREPKGIFGVGTIIDGPERRSDPTDGNADRIPFRCLVAFDALVDPTEGFLLSLGEIDDLIPSNLVDANASGTTVPANIVPEIERRLAPKIPMLGLQISPEAGDDPAFDPESIEDDRLRTMRAIRVRRGQPEFRAALLDAYGARCAITRCPVVDVLEAAHIFPYAGNDTNVISNGLLLRTDLHTLFDCGLLAIDPTSLQIVLSDSLMTSAYQVYAGKQLRKPANPLHRPSGKALRWRFAVFQAKHAVVT